MFFIFFGFLGQDRDVGAVGGLLVEARHHHQIRKLFVIHQFRNTLGVKTSGDQRGDVHSLFLHALDRVLHEGAVSFFGQLVEFACVRDNLGQRLEIHRRGVKSVFQRNLADTLLDLGDLTARLVFRVKLIFFAGKRRIQKLGEDRHKTRGPGERLFIVVGKRFVFQGIFKILDLVKYRDQVNALIQHHVLRVEDDVFVGERIDIHPLSGTAE